MPSRRPSPFSPLPASDLAPLRRRLLLWYRRHKRDLDWRRTSDPYAIWISEIMLQQTRVAAVLPYYSRWLTRFPDIASLARAPLDVVLRHWAGLGYYSRARNLHRAAREIVSRHGGKFPSRIGDALALPGVGAYTAAAVLSIAYGRPLAVLDGNVARVLARWGALRGDLREPRRWARLADAAGEVLAARAPGNWNQAMMELGAIVCTPRAPRCAECPVSRWCRAHALGIAEELPSPRRKPATVRLTLAAAVLLDPAGRTLLLRHTNGDGAFFSNLWQFPAIELSGHDAPSDAALAAHLEHSLGVANLHDARLQPLPVSRHTVTFHNIRLAGYIVRVPRLPEAVPVGSSFSTPRLAELDGLAISNATRKIFRAAQAAL